jgi:cytochrome b561
MRRRVAVETWSAAQRRLHWWGAGLIAVAFAVAWVMVAVPLTELLVKFVLYQVHKTLGLTVLALVLWRLVLRARRGRPAWEADLPPWQRRAASWMHVALYALALAVPVLGYFTAATAPARVPTLFLLVIPIPHVVGPSEAGFDVLRAVHRAAAILLVLLALGHAAAAVHNHRRGRATLARMWRGVAARAQEW